MTSFDPSWREESACKNSNTSDFFPVSVTRGNLSKIKEVFSLCESCPVNHHCLYDALLNDYDGVWGRTTRQQRNAYILSHPNYTIDDCKDFIDSCIASDYIPYTRSRTARVNTNL